MSRSYEERLSGVIQAKSGKPIRELSREYELHENKITEWICKYDKYGAESLKKRHKPKTWYMKFRESVKFAS